MLIVIWLDLLQTNVANREQTAIYIALDDVSEYSDELATAIESNASRYQKLFAECVDKLLPDFRTVDVSYQSMIT